VVVPSSDLSTSCRDLPSRSTTGAGSAQGAPSVRSVLPLPWGLSVLSLPVGECVPCLSRSLQASLPFLTLAR